MPLLNKEQREAFLQKNGPTALRVYDRYVRGLRERMQGVGIITEDGFAGGDVPRHRIPPQDAARNKESRKAVLDGIRARRNQE